MLPTKAYSRGNMALKYLAPAKPHSRTLLLIIEITLIGMEAMFLKFIESIHLNMRCAAVSISLLHSWQGPLWGHPRQMRRSVVQTRFWRINHAKALHFGGAQFAQTADFMKEVGGLVN
jgi:hypothetical protein